MYNEMLQYEGNSALQGQHAKQVKEKGENARPVAGPQVKTGHRMPASGNEPCEYQLP